MLFQTHVSYAAKLFSGTKNVKILKNVNVPPHYMTMAGIVESKQTLLGINLSHCVASKI